MAKNAQQIVCAGSSACQEGAFTRAKAAEDNLAERCGKCGVAYIIAPPSDEASADAKSWQENRSDSRDIKANLPACGRFKCYNGTPSATAYYQVKTYRTP